MARSKGQGARGKEQGAKSIEHSNDYYKPLNAFEKIASAFKENGCTNNYHEQALFDFSYASLGNPKLNIAFFTQLHAVKCLRKNCFGIQRKRLYRLLICGFDSEI